MGIKFKCKRCGSNEVRLSVPVQVNFKLDTDGKFRREDNANVIQISNFIWDSIEGNCVNCGRIVGLHLEVDDFDCQ